MFKILVGVALSMPLSVFGHEQCQPDRFKRGIQSIGISSKQAKVLAFEDTCSSEEFCFTFELLSSAKIEGFEVHKGAQIRYCEKGGLRQIKFIPETMMDVRFPTKDGLSCAGYVKFKGTPSQLCSCELGKEYSLNIKVGSVSDTVKLPQRSRIYFSNGKPQYFTSSDSLNIRGHTVDANGLYSAVSGDLSTLSRENIPDCEDRRKATEDEVDVVFKKYGLKRADFKDIETHEYCLMDKPYPYPESSQRGISMRSIREISTKDIKVSDGAYFAICNGNLDSVKSHEGVTLWGQNCRVSVDMDDLSGQGDPARYICALPSPQKLHHLTLPVGTMVRFDRKGIICFYRNREEFSPEIPGVDNTKPNHWFEGDQLKSGRCP